mgnify:CR=1 FL=1
MKIELETFGRCRRKGNYCGNHFDTTIAHRMGGHALAGMVVAEYRRNIRYQNHSQNRTPGAQVQQFPNFRILFS